jgi:hypothetical protein
MLPPSHYEYFVPWDFLTVPVPHSKTLTLVEGFYRFKSPIDVLTLLKHLRSAMRGVNMLATYCNRLFPVNLHSDSFTGG